MVEETNGDTSLVTKSELWVADGSPMKVSFVYSNMFWRLQIWLKYKPFFCIVHGLFLLLNRNTLDSARLQHLSLCFAHIKLIYFRCNLFLFL